ncbi:hypothetical protein GCM10028807_23760 [Spirosoma daeguense]
MKKENEDFEIPESIESERSDIWVYNSIFTAVSQHFCGSAISFSKVT